MDFSKTQNIFYNVITITLICWIVSFGDLFLFTSFTIVSHSHYVLSYIWTVKYDLQKIILLMMTALLMLGLYLSPISTEAIILIVSLAFLFHFWTDELRMSLKSKYQSLQAAHCFVLLMFIAVLAVLEYLRPQFKSLTPYMMLIPTTMIYQSVVIFHGVKWIFYTNKKWSKFARSEYIKYIFSLIFVHLFFIWLLRNNDVRSNIHHYLVAARALYCWGLIHIVYTFLNKKMTMFGFKVY